MAGGIKALIITQLGGVGLLAGRAGRLRLPGQLRDQRPSWRRPPTLPPTVLALIAFGFLVAAAAKSAQFPFQTWLPDAMEAPTPVSALIHAATMVNAGVYLLARFYPAFQDVPGWTTAVVIVGLLSALLAALMALVANDLKRALAYSTVSQLGYMVYAVGAGGDLRQPVPPAEPRRVQGAALPGAGAVIHAVGTRDMRQMGGLGEQMPFVRNVFVIGALALAGIPILNGFWSKELVLESGLADGPLLGLSGHAARRRPDRAVHASAWSGWSSTASRASQLHAARRPAGHACRAGACWRSGTLTPGCWPGRSGSCWRRALPFHEPARAGHRCRWSQEIADRPGDLGGAGGDCGRSGGLVVARSRLGRLPGPARAGSCAAAPTASGSNGSTDRVVAVTQGAAAGLRRTQTGQLTGTWWASCGGLVVVSGRPGCWGVEMNTTCVCLVDRAARWPASPVVYLVGRLGRALRVMPARVGPARWHVLGAGARLGALRPGGTGAAVRRPQRADTLGAVVAAAGWAEPAAGGAWRWAWARWWCCSPAPTWPAKTARKNTTPCWWR